MLLLEDKTKNYKGSFIRKSNFLKEEILIIKFKIALIINTVLNNKMNRDEKEKDIKFIVENLSIKPLPKKQSVHLPKIKFFSDKDKKR